MTIYYFWHMKDFPPAALYVTEAAVSLYVNFVGWFVAWLGVNMYFCWVVLSLCHFTAVVVGTLDIIYPLTNVIITRGPILAPRSCDCPRDVWPSCRLEQDEQLQLSLSWTSSPIVGWHQDHNTTTPQHQDKVTAKLRSRTSDTPLDWPRSDQLQRSWVEAEGESRLH